MIHDFQHSLKRSLAADLRQRCLTLYTLLFPDLIGVTPVEDLTLQRSGVDTILRVPAGPRGRSDLSFEILIEEKNRLQDYGDVSLEHLHVPTDPARSPWPGWAAMPLACDFVLYSTPSSGILLAYPAFRRAWLDRSPAWLQYAKEGVPGFTVKPCENRHYRSLSLNVPIHVLRDAGCIAAFVPAYELPTS